MIRKLFILKYSEIGQHNQKINFELSAEVYYH